MIIIDFGSSNDQKHGILLNNLLLPLFHIVGIVIDVKEVHTSKAFLPIIDTDVGISIDLNELHP